MNHNENKTKTILFLKNLKQPPLIKKITLFLLENGLEGHD